MSEMSSTARPQEPADAPIPLIDLVGQFQGIGDEVLQAVLRVFEEQKFVLGDEVAELECDLAEYCDSREAIGCASGTDALLLSLMALDIEPGSEIITSPYTFFATAGVIHRYGCRPVFVDIDPATFNVNPTAVDAALSSRTKALLPVHLFGQCADMEPLWRLATRHGIPIIEDACQAIGADYRKRRAGVLGQLGCFSFFPTKNLGGAGDGGLVTTDDPTLATRVRRLRVHGDIAQYEHVEVGLNSRLDALQAAVLSVKLRYLDDWTRARQRNAQRYATLFAEHELLDIVTPPTVRPNQTHVFNQYVIRIGEGKRDLVMRALRERSIGCAIYYPKPLHLQRCFESLGYRPGQLPEAERAAAETLALPIHPLLSLDQQVRIVRTISTALGRTPQRRTQSVVPRPKFLSSGSIVSQTEELRERRD